MLLGRDQRLCCIAGVESSVGQAHQQDDCTTRSVCATSNAMRIVPRLVLNVSGRRSALEAVTLGESQGVVEGGAGVVQRARGPFGAAEPDPALRPGVSIPDHISALAGLARDA